MRLHPDEPHDADPPVRRIDARIGSTPVVRLEGFGDDDRAEIWLKLERFNPAGSLHDRTALGLIEDAEVRGVLTPGRGQRIVEASTGNTGLALAFLGAVRGYRCSLVFPGGVSPTYAARARAYGAEVDVLGAEGRGVDAGMREAIDRAHELAEAHDAWMPNQFENPAHPDHHERVTGPEIWAQMQGRIDAFVWATGTGGSISGIGRHLKRQRADLEVVAVEPARSAVLSGGTPGRHGLAGMGLGFVPRNLDVDLLDRVIAVDDDDALSRARRLMRNDGISIGPSSGATLHAALDVARELGPGRVVLALAGDGGEPYLRTDRDQAEGGLD